MSKVVKYLFLLILLIPFMLLSIKISSSFKSVLAGEPTCLDGSGWTKVDSSDLTLYPVSGASEYCFKAGSEQSEGCVGGIFTSWPQSEGTCGLSHWSYFIPTSSQSPSPSASTSPSPSSTPTQPPVPTTPPPFCENPKYMDGFLDKIDLGNSGSEIAHSATGWGTDPGGGNYGGRDGGDFSLVVGNAECSDAGRSAFFTLDANGYYANEISVRHLDGVSNLDSFDVFANGNFVGHYSDIVDDSELWFTHNYPLANLTGIINVEIRLTDVIWPSCSTWGQLAINWVKIYGYQCPAPTESPISSETPTPTPIEEQTPTPSATATASPSPSEPPRGGPGPSVCPDPKPNTPYLVSAVTEGANSVRITWQKVLGPVTHYSIEYGPSAGNYPYSVVNTGDVDTFLINGISSGCFAVRAVNSCMPGDLSNEVCTGQVLGASSPQVLGLSSTSSDNEFSLTFWIGIMMIAFASRLLAKELHARNFNQ